MKCFPLLWVEIKRIFHSKTTWLVLCLAMLGPAAGYGFYQPATDLTKTSIYIGNPALAGALAGAVLAALLTLFELDRVHKHEMASLTDSIVSPLKLNVCRLAAVLAVCLAATILAMLLHLPYVLYKTHVYFRPGDFLRCYLILMLPGMWLGAVISALCYQLVRRIDVSFLLFAVFLLASRSEYFRDSFLLRWANPLIPVLSDDFSNIRILRAALYSRLFWFLLLGGIWLFSLLCVRRYGRGPLRSFLINGRNPALPLLSLCLTACGVLVYIAQPFVDHSPIEPVWPDKEFNEQVIMTRIDSNVTLHTGRGTISGQTVYSVENRSEELQQCILETNPGYRVRSASLGGAPVSFTDLQNDIDNSKQIILQLPGGAKGALAVDYAGYPEEWAMSREYMWGDEISGEYVSLRNTALTPRLYVDSPDMLPDTCDITMPAKMTPACSGDKPELLWEGGGARTWRLHDGSGRQGFILYAADYLMEYFEEAGMAIEFYYSRNHQAVMKRLEAMEMIRHVLDYCAERYGPLRFTKEVPLKLIQESAYNMGGGAFRNFSVMGETTFSEENLNDPARGANGAEVLAHEIIHQWWGLTWMMWDEDEWSSEGLTCYTTYRLMKELYGEEYAQKYYVDVWQNDYDNLQRSFYHRNPEYLDILPEKYAADIRWAQWSTRLYAELPLKLIKAAELLGGEDKLDEVLARLFQNTESDRYPYLYYEDFLTEAGLRREELSLD